jgi:hypothetical protein
MKPQFTTKEIVVEAFVLFATLLAIVACAIAWGVI